ncbi:MAG: hypothetical protein ACI9SE_003469, partial [Neolewinella sp.]
MLLPVALGVETARLVNPNRASEHLQNVPKPLTLLSLGSLPNVRLA